jgi:hypothetical protein
MDNSTRAVDSIKRIIASPDGFTASREFRVALAALESAIDFTIRSTSAMPRPDPADSKSWRSACPYVNQQCATAQTSGRSPGNIAGIRKSKGPRASGR